MEATLDPSNFLQNPLNELNKLIQMDLIKSASHCCNNKYKFPLFATKSQPKHLDRDRTLRKASSFSYTIVEVSSKRGKKRSKVASSEIRIKKSFQSNETDAKTSRLSELEKNLNIIKNQLYDLNKNRSIISHVISDLQSSYMNLMKRNQEQEKIIEVLKSENKMLSAKTPSVDDLHLMDVKKSLVLCETNLNKLDNTMLRLLRSYQYSKENELKYERENRKLARKNTELKNMLRQTINDLEKFQNDADNVKKLYDELNETCKYYVHDEKSTETDNLTTLITKLNPQSSSHESKIDEIKKSYREILATQEEIELKLKNFGEETRSPNAIEENKEEKQKNVEIVTKPAKEENTKIFETLIKLLYDEINKTWNRNKEIEERYKDIVKNNLKRQEKQSQSAERLEGRTSFVEKEIKTDEVASNQSQSGEKFEDQTSLVEKEIKTNEVASAINCPYCGTAVEEDYELECVCEPCEE